jgi:hypothetical protein
MRLNVKAFALTCGVIWGVGLFVLTRWLIAFEGVTRGLTHIGRVYRGYTISPIGSIIGLIWAFFDQTHQRRGGLEVMTTERKSPREGCGRDQSPMIV